MTAWDVMSISVGGIAAIVTAPWLLARAARKWGTDEVPIPPPRRLYDGHDDRLRLASKQRRQRAKGFRLAADRIESGGLTERLKVLPMADRRQR